ncbi:hypothetical protein MMPV_007129 [Pyropia vietnamensis]
MVEACETRLDIHLRGRALRDMDIFSKSDPFAVLYLDAAGSSAGDPRASNDCASESTHRMSMSVASSRRSSGSSSRSRRWSEAQATRPWGSTSDIPVEPRSSGRTRDAGLPPPVPSCTGRPLSSGSPAAVAGTGERKKKSRYRDSWSKRAEAAAADARRWTRVGVTETIQNQLNPQWVASFEVPYFFERTQWLLVKVYDRDSKADQYEDLSVHDFIGEAALRVPELVRASGQTVEVALTSAKRPGGANGWVTFVAEEVSTLKQTVDLDFGVEHIRPRAAGMLGLGTAAVRLNISRLQEVGRDWLRVHQSGVGVPSARAKGCFNFPRHTINTQKLCRGDPLQPMRVSILTERMGKERLVAEAEVNLRQLVNSKRIPMVCEGKEAGSLVVHAARLSSSASFLDYIMGGCEVSLVVGIDFTASNGDPSSPGTLHYTDRRRPNEYELAIRAVGDILALYDTDQVFQAYGFGGKLPPDYATASHCFELNGTDNPDCVGIDGVLEAYRSALDHVRLSGPTVFSEILDRVAREVADQRVTQASQRYSILLLITDGTINDIEATMEQIIRASRLPISVVILGVGDADWTDMNLLDADDAESPLHALVERDIVQFVPFRSYRATPEVLASKVLEEIPAQLLGFMKSRDIKPNPPVPLGPPPPPPVAATPPAASSQAALVATSGAVPPLAPLPPPTPSGDLPPGGVSPAMTHVVTSKVGEMASATASAAVLAATSAATPRSTTWDGGNGEAAGLDRNTDDSDSDDSRRRHRRSRRHRHHHSRSHRRQSSDDSGGRERAQRPPGYPPGPPGRAAVGDNDSDGGRRRHRTSDDRRADRDARRAAERAAERAAAAAAIGVPAAAEDWGTAPVMVTGSPAAPGPSPGPPPPMPAVPAAAAAATRPPRRPRSAASPPVAALPMAPVPVAPPPDVRDPPSDGEPLNDEDVEEQDDMDEAELLIMEQQRALLAQLQLQQQMLAEQQARLDSRRRRSSAAVTRVRTARRTDIAETVAAGAGPPPGAAPPVLPASAPTGTGGHDAAAAARRWQQQAADDAPRATSAAAAAQRPHRAARGSRRGERWAAEDI